MQDINDESLKFKLLFFVFIAVVVCILTLVRSWQHLRQGEIERDRNMRRTTEK
jgi:cell division protein FtsL